MNNLTMTNLLMGHVAPLYTLIMQLFCTKTLRKTGNKGGENEVLKIPKRRNR